MAKNSSSTDKFIKFENSLLAELTTFKDQHDRGEENHLRVARGNTLLRLAKIVNKVTVMGDPQLILDAERHCEQFDLEYFASTSVKKQSCIQTLQAIQGVKTALAAPLNPQRYRADLSFNVGVRNIDKVTEAPRDGVHIFVKSQAQKLAKAPGRMATQQEERYFRARREALKTALKLHETNCQKALAALGKPSK